MSLTRREVGSSNARKYHPNHFEGTIFNLEFHIEHKLSFKQEDRKKTAAYRQGVKKVYSVNTFCGRYQKYVLAMRKVKKKEETGFPKQGTLYGHLQDWNVINEDGPLCQGLLYFLFYFDVKSRWLGESPLEKQFYCRGIFQVISILTEDEK